MNYLKRNVQNTKQKTFNFELSILFLLLVVCVISFVCLTSCTEQKPKTVTEFTTLAQQRGYQIAQPADLQTNVVTPENIKESASATCNNSWTIYFLVLKDSNQASSAVDQYEKKFSEEEKTQTTQEKNTTSSKQEGNKKSFTANNSAKYTHLCSIDSTLVYVSADSKYKNDIENFLSELGYN